MKSFEKPFDDSSCAAACDGPNTSMFSSRSASANPSASGCSGPITTSVTLFLRQNFATPRWSDALSWTHSASRAMPGFPGATHSFSHDVERRSAAESACSRPPDPSKSIRSIPAKLRRKRKTSRPNHSNATYMYCSVAMPAIGSEWNVVEVVLRTRLCRRNLAVVC